MIGWLRTLRQVGRRGAVMLAGVLVGVLAVAGCRTPSGTQAESPEADVINTEVTLSAPTGHHVAQCWFPDRESAPQRGRIVAVVVPDTLKRAHSSARECVFASSSTPETHALGVTEGVDQSLGRFRERYVDPYEAPGGDDAVAQVTEVNSATVFDGRTGQTLAFDSYNDGEQRHQVIAQFEDVRLSWSVPADGFPDAAYDDSEQREGIATVQIVEDVPRSTARR